jgi:translation initiation factor 4B
LDVLQPYTAYVANLAYDIDEQDVVKFFNRLKIKGVRLPRDGDPETGRLKGFGYADFEDRDSLVEALTMNDLLLKNRKVRIDLATHAGYYRPNFDTKIVETKMCFNSYMMLL